MSIEHQGENLEQANPVEAVSESTPEKEKPAPGSREEFEQEAAKSREKAISLLAEIPSLETELAILSPNSVTIEKASGWNGAPEVTINMANLSEPSIEQKVAVQKLKDFLSRARNVTTRFPDQTYPTEEFGHQLQVLWSEKKGVMPIPFLETVKILLETGSTFAEEQNKS